MKRLKFLQARSSQLDTRNVYAVWITFFCLGEPEAEIPHLALCYLVRINPYGTVS